MILPQKKKKLLETVYTPIQAEYQAIRNSSGSKNDSQFTFSDYLRRSVAYAYRHPYFALLNKQLNSLSQKWDETLWQSRLTRAGTTFLPLCPNHSFLLVPEKKNSSASATLYNKRMPPDHRVVAIRISDISLQSLACIYHEMGHFIGFRNRQARLFHYFIPILVEKVLILIYEIACRSYISGTSVQSKSISSYTRYSDDTEYNLNVRTYANHVMSVLKTMYTDLLNCLDKTYGKESSQYVCNSLSSNQVYEEQFAKSIKMGFFASVHGLMLPCLSDVLSQEDNRQRWKQISMETVKDIPYDTLKDIWEQITKALNSIVTELDEAVEQYRFPVWYEECEQYLEETAADVFMLKMIRFSCKEYIDLIVQQLQNVVGSYSVESINRAIDKPVIHQRVISIAMAIGAQESDFIDDEGQNTYNNSEDSVQRKVAKQRLWNMYQCAKNLSVLPQPVLPDFFDPTKFLFKYVNELWHDERYAVFCDSNKDLLTTILECTLQHVRAEKKREAWCKLDDIKA